jgi:hypothetical protein
MQLRAGDYDGNFPTVTPVKEELFVFACRQVYLKACPEFWKGTMALLDFVFELVFFVFSDFQSNRLPGIYYLFYSIAGSGGNKK